LINRSFILSVALILSLSFFSCSDREWREGGNLLIDDFELADGAFPEDINFVYSENLNPLDVNALTQNDTFLFIFWAEDCKYCKLYLELLDEWYAEKEQNEKIVLVDITTGNAAISDAFKPKYDYVTEYIKIVYPADQEWYWKFREDYGMFAVPTTLRVTDGIIHEAFRGYNRRSILEMMKITAKLARDRE
jgi:thiol-disulfide isomerase/thioredoxin